MSKRKNKNEEEAQKPTPADYVSHMNKMWTISTETTSGLIFVDFEPLSDGKEAEIVLEMAQAGFTNWRWVDKTIRLLASRDKYSRYEMWLASLTPSDTPYIDRLIAKISTTDNEMFGRYLKIWLVNAIKRIYCSDVQNPMLVLSGGQGCGKSALAKWLSPQSDAFVEKHIDPDSDEDARLLSSKFVWEAGELGATTRKADVESLKAFMTKSNAEVRLPYDKHISKLPAVANFIGTVNQGDGFLNDASGSRRFHVVDILGIDWSYAEEMRVVEIWSNALHLFNEGYSTVLTKEEVAKRDGKNVEHSVDIPVSWFLGEYLSFTGDENDTMYSSHISSILMAGGYNGSAMGIGREVSSAMQMRGIKKGRHNTLGYYYKGVKRKFVGD